MKRAFLVLLLLVMASLEAMADPAVAAAQEKLKSQGFYYGAITGQKDADTVAALRRFQIRNGLKITGALDSETQRSLNLAPSAGTTRPAPTAPPRPRVQEPEEAEIQEPEDLEDNGAGTFRSGPRSPSFNEENEAEEQEGVEDEEGIAPAPNPFGPQPRGFAPQFTGIFAGTPYETAPPQVQQQVITGVQFHLARRGLYRSGIDGVFGPGTEFALRAYQSESGLAPTGRLDVDTLAALRLLPNQRGRISGGPRRFFRRPAPRAILRGEWIPY